MNSKKILYISFLALTLMGASKCQETTPPPHVTPDLSGAWQWSCVDLAAPTETLALSCAQQVPSKSPFLPFVHEYINFKDATNWSAFFAFGTCVDQQDGTYTHAFNETTNKDILEVFDSQGSLQQTYDVQKVSDQELKFSNSLKTCSLVKSASPSVLKGIHPKPSGVVINWDFDVDGAVSFWTSGAQFPFVYQSPQLQSRGMPFATYRADHVLLSILPDGAELSHYAAYIVLYDNATNTPLKISEVKELSPGVVLNIDYTDLNSGSIVKVKAQFQ